MWVGGTPTRIISQGAQNRDTEKKAPLSGAELKAQWIERVVPITALPFQFSLVNLVPSRPVACRSAYKKKPRLAGGAKSGVLTSIAEGALPQENNFDRAESFRGICS